MKLTKAIENIELDGPDLEDGEVIADIVILCRLMKADEKHSSMALYTSGHTDAIVQMGIIQSASVMVKSAIIGDGDGE